MSDIYVSGANGHLGWSIVQELLKRGYSVRGSVTNLNDPVKTDRLKKAGIEVVEARLEDGDSIQKAVKGCKSIFHVAAPFMMSSKNPKKDIYDAAILGTKNIMEAARDNGIQKIIYTSSVGTLGESRNEDGFSTEEDLIENPKLHYIRAKKDSEKLAWEYAEKYSIDVITVLPSGMIGPGFQRSTPTTEIFVKLFRNEIPMLPPFHLDYVDVRDVAKGHADLFEKKDAKGRFILNGEGLHTKEVAQLLREEFPDMKIPHMILPNWMMPAAVFFDLMESIVKGSKRLLTFDVVEEFGNGKMQKYSSQKARREINWNPRPVRESLRDTIKWIEQNFKKKNR